MGNQGPRRAGAVRGEVVTRPECYKDCTEECERRVECAVCHRPKPPRGRDVPVYMAGGYCERECPGHDVEPRAGHLWPGELERMDAEVQS
jgi:hypothetical protein